MVGQMGYIDTFGRNCTEMGSICHDVEEKIMTLLH